MSEHQSEEAARSSEKRAEPPRVSVVVPVRNGRSTLPKLLDSLAAQRNAPPFEVIVVDNGSTDDTVEEVQKHPLRPVIAQESKPGSYAARNVGLRHATGEFVAFIDADCVADADWLRAGVAALEDAGAELAGGRVEVILSASPGVWERLDAGHYLDQKRNVEQQGFAATANAWGRRDALEKLGGFAADLRSGGDREICKRALEQGMRLVYAHDALVLHHPRDTWRETWKLNRRIGYSLRDLHKYDMHPVWYRDQQMVLSPRWARGTSSTPAVRTSRPTAMLVWATVITARWVGRLTAR